MNETNRTLIKLSLVSLMDLTKAGASDFLLLTKRGRILAKVERLELEATIAEHKHVCDDCNWNNEGGLCDRAKELRAQLEKVKGER